MTTPLLFTPGLSNFMTKLYDSKSMLSVALRDGVDNTGRTVLEYQRNRHGGRERFIEEFGTMVIWGFGIHFLNNNIYNPIVKKLNLIKHPSFDMSLLKEGPQQLTEAAIHKYAAGDKELLKLVTDPKMVRRYQASSLSKFVLATMVPVWMIAFGIPTFNQWLTRRIIHNEKHEKTVERGVLQQVQPQSLSMSQPVSSSHFQAASGNNTAFSHHPRVFQKLHDQFQLAHTRGSTLPVASTSMNQAAQPLFGKNMLAELIQDPLSGLFAIQQSERANTLLIDGMISGGRTYKARNWTERMEIAFREASIIFFLFFAQGPLQEFFGERLNKMFHTNSHIHNKALTTLWDKYVKQSGAESGSQKLLSDVKQMLPNLGMRRLPELPQHENAWAQALHKFTGKEARLEEAIESKIVTMVREYIHSGRTDNLWLEAGKSAGFIPTVKNALGHTSIDLTQKIAAEELIGLGHQLQDIARHIEKNGARNLEGLLKTTANTKFSSFMLANAVCALFLSYVVPKVQHYITFKRTGVSHFPGVDGLEQAVH